MAAIDEIKKERIKKLERIRKSGDLAYPASVKRTHTVAEAVADFGKLSKAQKEIILVGRIRSIRGHGGSTFLTLEDGSGSMQAYVKKDRVGEQVYDSFLETFDIGDFIQVRGILFTTKKRRRTFSQALFGCVV
jgi:lysyl-tRNA synthetase class 2